MTSTVDLSFLGRGWSFPPTPAGPADVVQVAEDEDVRQAILLILKTAPGERVMRPDFGCGLRQLVFEPISSTLKTLVHRAVEDALTAWEPRIDVREIVVTTPPREASMLLIDIRYVVRTTNTFYNLVYPFYLQEQRL